MSVAAFDLNSLHLTSSIISSIGKIKFTSKTPLNNRSGDEVSNLLTEKIIEIIDRYNRQHARIKSVGISIPGIYNPQTGCVWAPNIPGWDNYPLKNSLLPIIREHILNLKIASKRSCNIRGEYWLGAAKKTRNAIYFSVNHGIGAGILVDGRILEGFNGGVGAVGWMNLNEHVKEDYLDTGFYEYYASGKGIINRTRGLLKSESDYKGVLKQYSIEELDIPHIFNAYIKNDEIAESIINSSIKFWGIAIANMISLFNPEKIIFGGRVFGPAFQFIDSIKEEVSKRTHPRFYTNVKFVQSELGEYSALLGAGHLVNKKL